MNNQMGCLVVLMLVVGVVLLALGGLFFGGTTQTFLQTGAAMSEGRVVVVPASTPDGVDCGADDC